MFLFFVNLILYFFRRSNYLWHDYGGFQLTWNMNVSFQFHYNQSIFVLGGSFYCNNVLSSSEQIKGVTLVGKIKAYVPFWIWLSYELGLCEEVTEFSWFFLNDKNNFSFENLFRYLSMIYIVVFRLDQSKA